MNVLVFTSSVVEVSVTLLGVLLNLFRKHHLAEAALWLFPFTPKQSNAACCQLMNPKYNVVTTVTFL